MTVAVEYPYGMKVDDDVPAAARSLVRPIDEKPTEQDMIDIVQRFRGATR